MGDGPGEAGALPIGAPAALSSSLLDTWTLLVLEQPSVQVCGL